MERLNQLNSNGLSPKERCTGLVFRCSVQSFLSKYNSVEVKKSLRLLKKQSCLCNNCLWVLDEFLKEDIHQNPKMDFMGSLESGKKYTPILHYSDFGPDWDAEIEFGEWREVK